MSRLASTKPLDPEVVRHVGNSPERCPSPSYVAPRTPSGAAGRIRELVGPAGESVIRYHASGEPVRGGLLERSEGVKRTVWVGKLARTAASEHAVRTVMRQAGHVAAVHVVKPPERSLKKPWALVVFREELAAERAASSVSSPLVGGTDWRIEMVKPERLPGKQLTIALDAWRQNKSSSRPRRASLDQLEADIVQYQQQREGLATAPSASTVREPMSPSRTLVQDMSRHPGAVGSRGGMGYAGTGEFDTPTKQRQPSFHHSGSPRNFFGITTPGSIHTPRGSAAERLVDKLGRYDQAEISQDGQVADSFEPGLEIESEALAKQDPKQLLSHRQPSAALYRLAYRAMHRLSTVQAAQPASPRSGSSSSQTKVSMTTSCFRASESSKSGALSNCMAEPNGQMRLAVETVCSLLKLPTELGAMQKLVQSGGLVPAMHQLDPSTLDDTAKRSLKRALTKLVCEVEGPSPAEQRLEEVISRSQRRPSPLHALCLWLYATYLMISPESAFSEQQAQMWSFCHLSQDRRLVDSRAHHAVAWARTTDLLRHMPDEQLRQIMVHADLVKAHPGQTVVRSGSIVNKISLVLAGTVTAFLTHTAAAAISRNNAALTLELWDRQSQLGTLVRYRSAAMYGSLGDTVQDQNGNIVHPHHEEWHRAIANKMAKNVGQQWQAKAKLQSARAATGMRVPLVLGPGAAIGRDKAVAECKRMYETEHEDGDRAVAAKRQWPLAANTTLRCSTPAIMLEFSRPKDVLAIGKAQEKAVEEKFTELFRFEVIKKLGSFSERRKLLPGEFLFEAGDGVDEYIFVLSGQLQITKPRTDGAVNFVAVVGAGSVFGKYPEMQACRKATVQVVGEDSCEVLAIHVYNMQHILADVTSDVTFEDRAAVAMSVSTAAAASVR